MKLYKRYIKRLYVRIMYRHKFNSFIVDTKNNKVGYTELFEHKLGWITDYKKFTLYRYFNKKCATRDYAVILYHIDLKNWKRGK